MQKRTVSMRTRRLIYLGVLFLTLLFSFISIVRAEAEEILFSVQLSELVYSHIIDDFDIDNVRRHIEFFGSLGSRFTGYLGNERAAQYIFEYFQNLSKTGIMENVTVDSFEIVVPVDYGGNVTILSGPCEGKMVEVHPLLPNFVCPSTTPPEGIVGHLIYAKSGYLEDFDGWKVNGSIVLLDWNSLDRWINAAKLGAKAVIFLPPYQGDLLQSLTGSVNWYYPRNPKYMLDVPLNFPRFYVDENGYSLLLENLNQTIRIVCTQRWENVTSWNILGFVRGAEYPQSYVVISAYYDSFSVVPSVSPGAQEACGIAGLLELARIFSQPENCPKNSMIFLALGAHHQSYAGMTEFVKDYLYPIFGRPETISLGLHVRDKDLKQRVKVLVGLDFSTGTNVSFIDFQYNSATSNRYEVLFDNNYHSIDGTTIRSWFTDVVERINQLKPRGRTYKVEMTSVEPEERDFYRPWKVFPNDVEISGALGTFFGVAFTTAYDPRPYFGEPFDTLEKVNFENLEPQLELSCMVIAEIAGLDLYEWPVLKNLRNDRWVSTGIFECMTQVSGNVAIWNRTRNGYTPLPYRALVNVRRNFGYGVFTRLTVTKEYGYFSVFPAQRVGNPLYGAAVKLTAWVIDEATGNIIYATDQGMHSLPGGARVDPIWEYGYLVVFNASTIVLFDLNELPQVKMIEDEPLESYGVWQAANVTVVAIPPNMQVYFYGKASGARYPAEVLSNASEGNPKGNGYTVGSGEQLIIPYTRLEMAESFYWLNEDRFKAILRYDPEITSSDVYQMHKKAGQLIERAREAIASYRYSLAEGYVDEALKISREVYGQVRSYIEDASSTVPFLALFFLPFTFLTERLIFSWRGIKRIFSFLGTFTILIIISYMIHPGFYLAANSMVNIMGVSLLILSVPLLIIISRYTVDFLQELRFARLGRHEAEISRITEVAQAFIIGVEHLRKAKLRSALTLTTIIMIVLALVNFTSIEAQMYSRPSPIRGSPLYNGIYIHRLDWGEGSFAIDSILPILKARYGEEAIVAPRAWKYILQASTQNFDLKLGFHLKYRDMEVTVPVILGLTPEETAQSYLSAFLIGRSFLASDRKVLVLSEPHAEALGIKAMDLPVKVSFEGVNYTVIGIISSEIEQVHDLDGEGILPIKLDIPSDEQDWETHVPIEYLVILPYEEVVNFYGGNVASVSILFENTSRIREAGNEISKLFPDLQVWSCVGEEILWHSQTLSIRVGGFEIQVIPMVIASLTILSNLIGSIYERRRNIFIYNSVGLSPLHVAFLFLAENLTYAVIGSLIGYLIGVSFIRVASAFLPSAISINYSSRWVIISVGTTMLLIILASLYPLKIASGLVTPSTERKWRIPTKPTGDSWEISLPFYAADDEEAKGILAYIKEYFEDHSIRDAPDFFAQNIISEEGVMNDKEYIGLRATVDLYPYDSGVSQKSFFYLVQIDPAKHLWACHIVLNRISGELNRWTKQSYHYIDLLRKQLLLWRSMKGEERRKYISMGSHLSGGIENGEDKRE